MEHPSFGTIITTSDPFPQRVVTDYLRKNYKVAYGDIIQLYSDIKSVVDQIIQKVAFLTSADQSVHIIIAGHHDCAGYDHNFEKHKHKLDAAVETMKIFTPTGVRVSGIYSTNENQGQQWKSDFVEGDHFNPLEGVDLGIVLKCMDGRTSDAVSNYLESKQIHIAKIYTFPGADGAIGELVEIHKDAVFSTKTKIVDISTKKHLSQTILVAGFENSNRNDGLDTENKVLQYTAKIRSWDLSKTIQIAPLFVYRDGTIEELKEE
ncbi:MAG: hypothetical protein HQM14_14680 [SAR324 cluster bacterium]|nr:hypothetical protein [SAR324 cluster bacterium]